MDFEITPKLLTRFWKKVEKTGNCWNWIGSLNPDGYGLFWLDNKIKLSHRISYMIVKGDIPKGLVIDHLCRNPSCVNPEHLEVVTIGENILRGNTLQANNLKKTHCPQGHEYTEDNIYRNKNNGRLCKTCVDARYKSYKLKNPEKYRQSVRNHRMKIKRNYKTMTQDLQAEIDSKEKCQEQLNIIYANAQTLLGDTKKYTKEHLAELESQIVHHQQ